MPKNCFYNYVEALAFTKLTTPTRYICSINFISFSFSNLNYIYLTHVNLWWMNSGMRHIKKFVLEPSLSKISHYLLRHYPNETSDILYNINLPLDRNNMLVLIRRIKVSTATIPKNGNRYIYRFWLRRNIQINPIYRARLY